MTDAFSPPSAERASLAVTGMTCTTCAMRLRKALREVPGVLEAEVDFATRSARVVRGAGQAGDALLLAAVARAGYGASLALPLRQEWARREAGEAREARGWLLRALAGGAATGLLLVLHAPAGNPWLSVLLAAAVQIGVGLPFYRGAWAAIRRLSGSMDLLVAMGATAGFALALAGSFGHLGAAPVHLDCAPAILSVVCLGKWLEARCRRRAGQAVRGLMAMLPSRARVLRDGRELELGIEEVRLGDRLRVAPNAAVPVDGVVEAGSSRVDESSMTGEAAPAAKGPGDRVSAGTLNGEGALEIRAERVGEETLLARIAARVASSQASRASASRLADRAASLLVPAVLAAALGALLLWGLGKGRWTAGWTAATAVLLVACPCALGLAIPAALAVGVGAAARRGVLFRDVESLERAGRVRAVLFDKTGTLTLGASRVAWLRAAPGEDPARALALAASAERHEAHPAARAVVAHALAGGVPLAAPSRVLLVPGAGVDATLPDGEVLAGSAGFLRGRGVDLACLEEALREAEAAGLGTVCAALDGRPLACLATEEAPRPGAAEALAALRGLGCAVGMLSGDREARALPLGAALGFRPGEVHAGVLPERKAGLLSELAAGRGAAMVGDGVNDAAALASAELGIALGTGSELAREAAAVTLVADDLGAVPWTLGLARAVRRVILQNLAWAFGYNLLSVPLAMAGLLSPWQAAALMALSDLVVVVNALTLPWRASR